VSSTPLEGWYPDPSGGPSQRFWDGQQWTGREAPAPKPRPIGLWIALGIVAAVVLFLAGYTALVVAGSDFETTATRDRGGPAVSAGIPVRDGNLEFVVSDVSSPSNWRGDPRPRGQWIIATVMVRNVDNEPRQFLAAHQKLIDSTGHIYAADTQAAVTMNKSPMVIDVAPGHNVTMKVPFDVPAGTQPTTVELHDSVFSNGARVQVN
jgi:hypothetical protein